MMGLNGRVLLSPIPMFLFYVCSKSNEQRFLECNVGKVFELLGLSLPSPPRAGLSQTRIDM